MLLVTKRFLYYFCCFSNVKLDLINNHKKCLLNLNSETVYKSNASTKINFSLIGSKFFYVSQFYCHFRSCYCTSALTELHFCYLYLRYFWLCLTCDYLLWKNLLCKKELIQVCIMWLWHVEKCNVLFHISVWWWTMLLWNQRPSPRPQKVRVALAVVAMFMLLSKCWHGAE